MREWIIIYGDSSVYVGEPENAPVQNVQFIVFKHERVGFGMLHASDFYTWDDDRWTRRDWVGMIDYLTLPGWKRVLIGRTIPDEDFNRLYQWAKSIRDYGRENGEFPEVIVEQ